MKTLIQIKNLHYKAEPDSKDEHEILHGITLEIEAGSFTAIIGENGSGKTTLINHINGILLPTEGCVLIDGMDTRQPEHIRKIRSLVGMVFQNPANQIVSSTVEEDVAFGLENKNMPSIEMRKRVANQLDLAGLAREAKRPPHLLSGGQMQRLALAGVLVREPEIIVFDEPTAMLDPITRREFISRILKLCSQGKTIVYVTHHLEEINQADKVVVLKDGLIRLTGTPEHIFKHEEILHETGLDLPPACTLANDFRSFGWDIPKCILSAEDLLNVLPEYPGRIHMPSKHNIEEFTPEHIITARDVHYTYLSGSPLAQPALNGVDLDVIGQHVHGLAGINGSGKSTLLQHLNGILRPEKGTVRVGNLLLEDPKTTLREVIRKVGMVFQSPETQFFEVYVGDEIAYGPKQFGMEDVRDRVRDTMALVGLDFECFKDRRLETLSGGEKRRVALASTLVLDQGIFLFDEPTAGMDPRARKETLALINQFNEAGKTIVIASHQLDELALVSQNISLMQSGRVIDTSSHGKNLLNAETINRAGLFPPLSVRVSQALIHNGWPIDGLDTTTPDRLFGTLKEVLI